MLHFIGCQSRVVFNVDSMFHNRDFKIGDYGLPTVRREAFGTGTRQRALP